MGGAKKLIVIILFFLLLVGLIETIKKPQLIKELIGGNPGEFTSVYIASCVQSLTKSYENKLMTSMSQPDTRRAMSALLAKEFCQCTGQAIESARFMPTTDKDGENATGLASDFSGVLDRFSRFSRGKSSIQECNEQAQSAMATKIEKFKDSIRGSNE